MTIAVPTGCSRDVSLLPDHVGKDASATVDVGPADIADAEVDTDAGAGASDTGPLQNDAGDAGPAACPGLGDPILFPTGAGPVCASVLSARAHRFALCSCDSLDLGGAAAIHADSFNSRAMGTTSGASAAIGVGGTLQLVQSSAEIVAGGALVVASGLVTLGHIEAARSLRVGSSMVIFNTVHVAGDAYVDGYISGVLQIDGILHQPAGLGSDPPLPESSIRREPVSDPRPCDCSAGFVDLTGALSAAVAKNDNAVAGWSSDALTAVTTSTIRDVNCGTYVLSGINASQTLVLSVHGRSLLVVTGDVVLTGGLTVVLDPGAELDLVIGGRLLASGGGPLGSSASPARFRIWIAGSDAVALDNAPIVGAMVHAPGAALTAPDGLKVFGGLFARSVLLGGQLDLHFDEAVLSSGVPCGEPTETSVQ